MAHSTDIVGYTYKADIYCAECIVPHIVPQDLWEAFAQVDAEDILDLAAKYMKVDRLNEDTFDSDDFPKVVFREMVHQTSGECSPCGECGTCLDCGEDARPRITLSSNAFSLDTQTMDVVSHIQNHHAEQYAKLLVTFPELVDVKFMGIDNSWIDTASMGVNIEWGSWLIDAIENAEGLDIRWDDGEPYCYDAECQ